MIEGNKKEVKFCCPSCGYEYLPAEVFIPDSLLGKPKDIERSIEGKILLHDGYDQEPEETFTCEHCGKPFRVVAHMSFETFYDSKRDFLTAYSEPLYKEKRYHLEEN